MCRSVDRELLASADFRDGLDSSGQRFLVSTGRFALRGIGRAQDLYTIDPDIGSDESIAASYARYLAT
jgi:adenylate cyclase